MKAKLYINGIYWTSYTIPNLRPYLYVALHTFHNTEILFNKRLTCDRLMMPIMTFEYKTRYNEDAVYYSLIRIDN